ncbi:MAG: NTP transferase domain-containing protein [Terriglobales bacterium]
MNAVILAAGHGKRMRPFTDQHHKSLLRFGGETLLERHIRLLHAAGVGGVWVVAGHLAAQIEAALQQLPEPAAHIVYNNDFHLGNALSLLKAAEVLAAGPCLVIDADLLYDGRVLHAALASKGAISVLTDPALNDSGEEVKVVLNVGGSVCELAKAVRSGGRIAGESLGIFRFGREAARALASRLPALIAAEPLLEVETAVTGLAADFDIRPVSVAGLPWVEIDFWDDVERARNEIYPRLSDAAAGAQQAPASS